MNMKVLIIVNKTKKCLRIKEFVKENWRTLSRVIKKHKLEAYIGKRYASYSDEPELSSAEKIKTQVEKSALEELGCVVFRPDRPITFRVDVYHKYHGPSVTGLIFSNLTNEGHSKSFNWYIDEPIAEVYE